MSTWFQLYVKTEEPRSAYTTPRAMKRIDDHIFTIGGMMNCPSPEGMPVQEADGTWEVRVLQEAMLPFVKQVLVNHYGLTIVREVANSEE